MGYEDGEYVVERLDPELSGVPTAYVPGTGGEDWQYVSSADLADGYRHTFRHPRHPLTGRPEVRTIETRAAEVVAQQRSRMQEDRS